VIANNYQHKLIAKNILLFVPPEVDTCISWFLSLVSKKAASGESNPGLLVIVLLAASLPES
jgi:hypothetical protein